MNGPGQRPVMRSAVLALVMVVACGCRRDPDAIRAEEIVNEAPPIDGRAPETRPARRYSTQLRPIPFEGALRPAAACDDLHHASRGSLERRVAEGDACAAAALASLLLDGLGPPADYDRAAGLAAAAQDAGVRLDERGCFLFDLAGDRERLAACHRSSPRRTAVALAYGDGVPRDVAGAREIALVDASLLALVDAVANDPAPGQQRLCELLESYDGSAMRECASEDLLARDVEAAGARARAVAVLPAPAYAKLHAAFMHHRDLDVRRKAVATVGSVAGWFAILRRHALHRLFDETLLHLARHRLPSPASEREVAALVGRVEALEKEALTHPHLREIEGASAERHHARLVRDSARAFRRFEQKILAIAQPTLGPAEVASLRAALWRDREIGLGSGWGP